MAVLYQYQMSTGERKSQSGSGQSSEPQSQKHNQPQSRVSLQDKIEALTKQYLRTRTEEARNTLVAASQPLARLLASRYNQKQDNFDDLVQVANLGLMKAMDDFDPSQGVLFTTYAGHKMLGEIRRFLRDKGNHIKIPRRLYEISPKVLAAKNHLTAHLGQEPTIEEIASECGASVDIVLDVLMMGQFLEPPSLDAVIFTSSDHPGAVLADIVGGVDPTLHDIDSYADLRHALQQLTARERNIIVGRFFDELPQAELAAQLGISQMHVSRLERKALQELRTILHESGHDVIPLPPNSVPKKRTNPKPPS